MGMKTPFANSESSVCGWHKRIGHGAMEVFLLLNGHEIDALVDEQEKIIIAVASGKVLRRRRGSYPDFLS